MRKNQQVITAHVLINNKEKCHLGTLC